MMDEVQGLPPIVRTVTVPVAVERAFACFVEELGRWWPGAYTWSGDVLEKIGIEARPGGHCFEIGPDGFRCDWGTVQVLEAPERLIFSWQINFDRTPQPDPQKAGSVEVRFAPQDEQENLTQVSLTHFDFEHCGADADAYRAGLDSPEGWTLILERYREYCDQ
jgi:uncharacterized protein YndB with AHSA1/START domain